MESKSLIIFLNSDRFIRYVKWQLLLSEYVFATASLESSWTIMHEKRFPLSSRSAKLSESASFACVELAEAAMQFAVARPFVDELINKNTTHKVISNYHHHIIKGRNFYEFRRRQHFHEISVLHIRILPLIISRLGLSIRENEIVKAWICEIYVPKICAYMVSRVHYGLLMVCIDYFTALS